MPQVNTPAGGAPRKDHGKKLPALGVEFLSDQDRALNALFATLDRAQADLKLAESVGDAHALPDLRELVADLQARYDELRRKAGEI